MNRATRTRFHLRLEALEPRMTPSATVYGDFNGDGFDDLAIGVPGEDLGDKANVGAVNVIYGTAQGLRAANNQLWHQNGADVENANEASDQFGTALAIGDFNGDGYDDLAVGSPYEDIGNLPDAGAVNVIYGSPGGLSATFVPDQFWSQDAPGTKHRSGMNDHYGAALAVADFNNDGIDDLAIGVPGNSAGDIINVQGAGGVSILFGTTSGLTADVIDDQWFDLLTVGLLGEPRTDDHMGASLAAGDFNGDGNADLAIGIPHADAGVGYAIPDVGAVTILYGNGPGLSSAGNQLWYQGDSKLGFATSAGDVVESGDRFGWALAAGDFDGNGLDDLAIGVPYEGQNGLAAAGIVQVLNGSPAGLTATGAQTIHQNSPGVADDLEAGDRFGYTLQAGQFNGDGRDDLVVSVPYEDVGAIVDAGLVHVLLGSPTGLTGTGGQVWTQNSGGVLDMAEAADHFGISLGQGDFNGDGWLDLVIGVPQENLAGVDNAGAVIVLYGSATGLTATGKQLWSQNSPGILDSNEAGDQFGSVVAGATVSSLPGPVVQAAQVRLSKRRNRRRGKPSGTPSRIAFGR